jgi:hypothetical protein
MNCKLHTYLALTVFMWLAISTGGQCAVDSPDAAKPVTGVRAKLLDVNQTDRRLQVRYQITNDSAEDIWICSDVAIPWAFEASLMEDTQTLRMRRRTDVPLFPGTEFYVPPSARYVRLPAGRHRIESVVLSLPVHLFGVSMGGTGKDNTVWKDPWNQHSIS